MHIPCTQHGQNAAPNALQVCSLLTGVEREWTEAAQTQARKHLCDVGRGLAVSHTREQAGGQNGHGCYKGRKHEHLNL